MIQWWLGIVGTKIFDSIFHETTTTYCEASSLVPLKLGRTLRNIEVYPWDKRYLGGFPLTYAGPEISRSDEDHEFMKIIVKPPVSVWYSQRCCWSYPYFFVPKTNVILSNYIIFKCFVSILLLVRLFCSGQFLFIFHAVHINPLGILWMVANPA